MEPGVGAGVFAVTIENVTASFAYRVTAAGARSPDYTITVVRPPRVERIDVRYEFPRGLGLEPRTDEDSGDIYGPAGTKVRLTDHHRQADRARRSSRWTTARRSQLNGDASRCSTAG